MVGHDLNRGTSAFRRRPRLSSTDSREAEEAPPGDEVEAAAGLSAEERAAKPHRPPETVRAGRQGRAGGGLRGLRRWAGSDPRDGSVLG